MLHSVTKYSPLETLPRVWSVLSADELCGVGGQLGSHFKQEQDRKGLSALTSLLPGIYLWFNYPAGKPQVLISLSSTLFFYTVHFKQLFSVSRRICNEGFIANGRSTLAADKDRNIAIVMVNSFSLVITISSLTYIFRLLYL